MELYLILIKQFTEKPNRDSIYIHAESKADAKRRFTLMYPDLDYELVMDVNDQDIDKELIVQFE